MSRITALDEVLGKGSFKIRRWYCSSEPAREQMQTSCSAKPVTNHHKTKQAILTEEKSSPPPPEVDASATTSIELDGERVQGKTLGVGWNPQTDIINFAVKDFHLNGKFTKRRVLSKVSQIYDRFGLA